MQKDVDKDLHLVVYYLESREYYGHVLHMKGVNPLVYQILDDVCPELATSLGGFPMPKFR